MGTTSACAENTGRNANHSPCPGNYLRVRGEYSTAVSRLEDLPELPPRARRILDQLDRIFKVNGTTSACAENTTGGPGRTKFRRNYLRVRGEYYRHRLERPFDGELPPRARRIHVPVDSVGVVFGTTSACAENTLFLKKLEPGWWNYLRVRGEYRTKAHNRAKRTELPPRARGIPFTTVNKAQ